MPSTRSGRRHDTRPIPPEYAERLRRDRSRAAVDLGIIALMVLFAGMVCPAVAAWLS